jgi:hypothetical protein
LNDWPKILAGDEVMATALLDRLLLEGRGYRACASSRRRKPVGDDRREALRRISRHAA